MERVVEALGDAGAGRVVRVSDQRRAARAPRASAAAEAAAAARHGGAERGDARASRGTRAAARSGSVRELQGDAHDGRRLGRHALGRGGPYRRETY